MSENSGYRFCSTHEIVTFWIRVPELGWGCVPCQKEELAKLFKEAEASAGGQ